MSVDTTVIVVKKGDTLWNIVKAHGFPPTDYEKIYKAPYNKAFRAKRPDPGLIFAGDKLHLPRFTPAELRERVKQIRKTRRSLDALDQPIERLRREIQRVRASKTADEKAFRKFVKDFEKTAAELDKKAATYLRISDEAATAACNTRSGLACGVGGGGVMQKYKDKSDRAKQKKEALAGQLKTLKNVSDANSGKARKALENMERVLAALVKLQAEMRRDLDALATSMEAAAKNPY